MSRGLLRLGPCCAAAATQFLGRLVAGGRRGVECLFKLGHLEPGGAQRIGRHVQPGDAEVCVTQRDGALVALTPVLSQRCVQVAVPAVDDSRSRQVRVAEGISDPSGDEGSL